MKVKTMFKSETKFAEYTEGHIVATSKHWSCTMGDDDKRVPLAIYIEILNMDDATGEKQFKHYPYVVSFSIVSGKPHKSYNEADTSKPDVLSLIYDAHSYMGGVPIDHTLLNTDKLNEDLTSDLKAKEAKLVTEAQNFGTLAAQQGKGAEITYPQFKTYDAAEKWAKEMVLRYGDPTMTLCGFILDRPINMIGDSGWSVIESMTFGKGA